MLTVKVRTGKEVVIKTLEVEAGVRYWEDAIVNGVEDIKGDLIPCREGDLWKPIIDVELGKIINWKQGVRADVHYKVCDSGSYYLKDSIGNTVLYIDGDYVPEILSPKENGYGDYIIMDIDENGVIANWKQTLSGFPLQDED